MSTIPVVDAWNGPGARDETVTEVRARDNALHPSRSRWAFEHWYFDAHLDSGHTVVAFLQKRRPEEPPGSKPVVELLVYDPDGRRRQVTVKHPKSDFSASVDQCEVAIGASHAHSDWSGDLPVHHLHAEEEGLVFDLTFRNTTVPWMPGTGLSRIGDRDSFGWVVPAPRAEVSGQIVIDGAKQTVSGLGYHDHNWGVGNMPRIIDRWHWGRLYADDLTLLYACVRMQRRFGDHESMPVMLARGRDVVLSTGEVTLTEGPTEWSPQAHRHYPTWLRLQAQGEDGSLDLRLDVRQVIHAHDLLDDTPVGKAPMVKPLVRRLVGEPGYFRFRSDFSLTTVLDGKEQRREGSTLHELVALS